MYCWHVIVIRHVLQYYFGHLMVVSGCTGLYRGGQEGAAQEETVLN